MPRRGSFRRDAGGASHSGSIDCGGVFSPDPGRRRSLNSVAKTFITAVFVSALVAFAATGSLSSLQGTDFPDFYCAARLLAAGHGHQLYDPDLQRQYQAHYAGRVGTLYIHPPFEAVLYLAVAWLPLRFAYLVWSLLNLAFLGVATRRLAGEMLPRDWRLLLAASLTFVPALLCFLQGQDSLLLLLLIVLAFTALRSGRAFAAGCWVGLGLFKFQLALPVALVLVVTQSRNVRAGLLKGFGLVALALAGLSAAISGWSVFLIYPKFVLHLKTQPFAGVVPQAMANFRGLIYLLVRSDQSSGAVISLSILCAAALIITLMGWKKLGWNKMGSNNNRINNKKDEFDLAFANTVMFALLVSYHLNPHDLSLLLLPIALLLQSRFERAPRARISANWMTFGLLGILFLPPLHLWTLRAGVYALVSLPLLALFLSVALLLRQEEASAVS
jgi:Glycosyltransferase family 87